MYVCVYASVSITINGYNMVIYAVCVVSVCLCACAHLVRMKYYFYGWTFVSLCGASAAFVDVVDVLGAHYVCGAMVSEMEHALLRLRAFFDRDRETFGLSISVARFLLYLLRLFF